MKSFITVGCVSALLGLIFFPPLAVIGMICGVLLLARNRLNIGAAILVIAAAAGYLGMVLDLPYGDIVWRNVSHAVWSASQPQSETTSKSAVNSQDWHIVSLQTKVTKTDGPYSLCSWKLVVRNDSAQPAIFHGSIEFQDARGVKVLADKVNVNGSTQVAAESDGVFTGSQLISSQKKVARAVPNIEKGG